MRVRFSVVSLMAAIALLVGLTACGSSSAASSEPAPAGGDSATSAGAAAAQPAVATQDLAAESRAGGYIPSIEAGQHMGEEVTVRGLIADYQVHRGKPGKPFLLLFDVAGAVERGSSISDMETPTTFTLVIWGKDKKAFPPNFQAEWNGRVLCVTGTVEDYRGSPAIIASQGDEVVPDC